MKTTISVRPIHWKQTACATALRTFPVPVKLRKSACVLFIGAFIAMTSAASTESRLKDLMEYYVRDGGIWLAENSKFDGNDNSATHFGYEFEWMFGQRDVRLIIFGLAEDGTRTDYHECIYVWNPDEAVIQMFQYTYFGGYGQGVQREIAEGHSETVIEWLLPDGSRYVFKDEAVRIDANTFENRSYERDEEGQWKRKGGFTWIRQKSDAPELDK